MTELIFHTPWWLPTSIIALGVVLFLSGNKRTIQRLRNVGLMVAGLGVLLAAVSWLVDTDIEKVTDRSRKLVAAGEAQEWPAMEALLAPDVQFTSTIGNLGCSGRAELLEAARNNVQRVGLKSATVFAIKAERAGPDLKTGLRIFTDTDKMAGQQVPSDWTFRWHKVDGQWLVTELHLESVGDLSAQAAKQQLPN